MDGLRSRVAAQVASAEQEAQEKDKHRPEAPEQEHAWATSDQKETCAGRERPTLAQVLGALRGGK